MARLFLLVALLLSPYVHAGFDVQGLLDIRVANVDGASRSWLSGGVDPLRTDHESEHVLLGQLAGEGRWQLSSLLVLRGAASIYNDDGDVLGVNELYVHIKPPPSSAWRLRARVGSFYPKISLENTRVAWTSNAGISNSVINTWLGEEIRLSGAELSWEHLGRMRHSQWDVGGDVALFGWNDASGALVSWRGWGQHDRQVRVGEKLYFAPIPAIVEGGAFEEQSPYFEPFVEVDGRPGYALTLFARQHKGLKLTLFHYDNRANPEVLKDGQYGWRTRFHHVSLSYPFLVRGSVRAQWLRGKTLMGFKLGPKVSTAFDAWYLALVAPFGKTTWMLRYDDFSVTDLDLTFMDNNTQNGYSVSLSVDYALNPSLLLKAQYLLFDEHNAVRQYLGQDSAARYQQSQIALQWRF